MRAKINNVSINYELAGSGEVLSLIHGLSGNLTFWADVVPALAEHYRVLTWDVRGHGQSDLGEETVTTQLLARDLYLLLKALNIDRTFVLGHSMGGVIALRFALDYPEMTKALLVVSSSSECKLEAAEMYEEMAQKVEKEGLKAVEEWVESGFSPAFRAQKPEVVAEFKQRWLQTNPATFARCSRAMGDLYPNPLTPELEKIKCPTLVIVGGLDVMTPPGGSVIMHRRIPGSELRIVKDRGHILYMEDPEQYTAAILQFMASV